MILKKKKKAFICRMLLGPHLVRLLTKRFQTILAQCRHPLTPLFLSLTFILNLSLLWEIENSYRLRKPMITQYPGQVVSFLILGAFVKLLLFAALYLF